ncbi:MAG: MBL fold metallo-hydrolase [Thermoplasmata archaeon]
MKEGPKAARILIPTQLPVGTVNAYLLTGDENVLVDTGPHHPESRRWLEKGLSKAGLRVGDIDILLITHGHVDHYGQAGDLSADSGAEVWVPELERDTIADFAEVYDERGEFYRQRLLKTGVPKETLKLMADFFDYVKKLATASPVHRTFKEGDRLTLAGWELEVIHTPGHSPGSSCFRSGSTIFTGDTVLSRITPNAAFGGADGKSVGMGDYLQSLEKLRSLDVEAIYPGHGPLMEKLRPFIENYLALYRSRREALIDLLRRVESTPFELAIHLFGSLPIHEVFLGLTEVLGHLEILQRENLVAVDEREGLDYFTLVA